MTEYHHKQYASGFSVPEPETEEEFLKIIAMARDPMMNIKVIISKESAKRFAHLLPEHMKTESV